MVIYHEQTDFRGFYFLEFTLQIKFLYLYFCFIYKKMAYYLFAILYVEYFTSLVLTIINT
jgi:hypothetical protein